MKEYLRLLDVTETEADVLLRIIEHQPVTATQLIHLTGQHRKVIYDIIYRLDNRALITSKKEGKERKIWFAGEEAVDAYVQEQEQLLAEKRDSLETFKQELTNYEPSENPEAYILSGKRGVAQVINMLTKIARDYYVIGAPEESETLMGERFWARINTLQAQRKQELKMIFNSALRGYGSKLNSPNIEIRYFDLIDPLAEIVVCGDYVAHIIWTQVPQVHVIKHRKYADSQREYFSILWEQANP